MRKVVEGGGAVSSIHGAKRGRVMKSEQARSANYTVSFARETKCKKGVEKGWI